MEAPMKRKLINLLILIVVFVIFTLVVGQFRDQTVELTLPFFVTSKVSVEGIAYVAFFTGLLLAGGIAASRELALRRAHRKAVEKAQADAQKAQEASAPAGGSSGSQGQTAG